MAGSIERGTRSHGRAQEWLRRILGGGGDDADRVTSRKTPAETGTGQSVADADVHRRCSVLECQTRHAIADRDGANTVAQDVDGHGVGWIGDQQHSAGDGRRFHDLTKQAGCVDHRLTNADPVPTSLV